MIEGKTKTGFSFSIDVENVQNMELLDAIAEVDTDPRQVPRVLLLLLGKEQKKKLYDHCRDESGRVPFPKVEAEVIDIFESCKDLKKSQALPCF